MSPNSSSTDPQTRISIIVPTYNYGHFIGQTLESVQAQTYQNWECIVVDDGSTDQTREVVARYAAQDHRIKYLYQETQKQAAAKNHGIQNSMGTYLQFLDADDLIETKKLERQVEYLEQHPEIDIVYGNVRFFRTENLSERLYSWWGEDGPWMPEISGRGKGVLMALVRRNIMVINAPLIRRRVVDTVGLFDERLPPAEDWDYWIRCAAQGKLFQYEDLEDTLALVRSHPSSSSRDRRRMFTSMLLIREKIKMLTADPDVLELNRAQAIEDQGSLAIEEVIHGRLTGRFRQLFKAGVVDKRIKQRAKWFTCAFVSPFLTRRQLRRMISLPLSEWATAILQKSKTTSP